MSKQEMIAYLRQLAFDRGRDDMGREDAKLHEIADYLASWTDVDPSNVTWVSKGTNNGD